MSVAASSGGARDAALEALASGSFAGSLSSGLHNARYHHLIDVDAVIVVGEEDP